MTHVVLADSSLNAIASDPWFALGFIAVLVTILLVSTLINKIGEVPQTLRVVPEVEDPDPCAICRKRVVVPEREALLLAPDLPVAFPVPEIYYSCGSHCQSKNEWIDRNRRSLKSVVA